MSNIDDIIQAQEPESIELSETSLGAWSTSKLKVAQQCPLRFYLQYILKVKHGGAPPSLVTDVGKAVHRILEFVIMGKTIKEAFEATKKEFAKEITPQQWEENLSTLEFNVIEFRKRLDAFEKTQPVKRYIQELRIGVTRDYQPTAFFGDDVFFRGVIDLGMQLESNDMIILDHKTGAPSIMGIRNFQTQLDIYKVLFHHGVQNVEGAQAGIHFVKDGKVLLDDYMTKDQIEGKLVKELEFYITGTVDKLKEANSFKRVRGNHCKWCDYNEICKAGQLALAEERSKKYFK